MAFLDDYEARYKLEGTVLVRDMLQHVPGDILQRTGVDGLVQRVSLLIAASNFTYNFVSLVST